MIGRPIPAGGHRPRASPGRACPSRKRHGSSNEREGGSEYSRGLPPEPDPSTRPSGGRAVVGLAIVLVAIVVYSASDPVHWNTYNHFVWQADAFLHGRVWFAYPVQGVPGLPDNWYFQDVYPIADPTAESLGHVLLPFPRCRRSSCCRSCRVGWRRTRPPWRSRSRWRASALPGGCSAGCGWVSRAGGGRARVRRRHRLWWAAGREALVLRALVPATWPSSRGVTLRHDPRAVRETAARRRTWCRRARRWRCRRRTAGGCAARRGRRTPRRCSPGSSSARGDGAPAAVFAAPWFMLVGGGGRWPADAVHGHWRGAPRVRAARLHVPHDRLVHAPGYDYQYQAEARDTRRSATTRTGRSRISATSPRTSGSCSGRCPRWRPR